MKVPGSGYEVRSVNMDFHYSELNDHYIPSAYERLIWTVWWATTCSICRGKLPKKHGDLYNHLIIGRTIRTHLYTDTLPDRGVPMSRTTS